MISKTGTKNYPRVSDPASQRYVLAHVHIQSFAYKYPVSNVIKHSSWSTLQRINLEFQHASHFENPTLCHVQLPQRRRCEKHIRRLDLQMNIAWIVQASKWQFGTHNLNHRPKSYQLKLTATAVGPQSRRTHWCCRICNSVTTNVR